MTDLWRSGARPMAFDSEDEAEEFVARTIAPFCSTLKRQAVLTRAGYRIDIGFRLNGLPDVPLAIEVKQFSPTNIKPVPEAIPQAWSYAREIGTTCFVGPFQARNVSAFDWKGSPLGAAALVACHWSVGFVYFVDMRDGTAGGLMLGQNNVAVFFYDDGEPLVRLHSDARRLLQFKSFDGSHSSRKDLE